MDTKSAINSSADTDTTSGAPGFSNTQSLTPTITWQQFECVELRAGTVVDVQDFPEARKPAWIITADFGDPIGLKKTSAQITTLYGKDDLMGRQILAVLNFPVKQIGPIRSEFLLTGFYCDDGAVVLAMPERPVPNGAKLA